MYETVSCGEISLELYALHPAISNTRVSQEWACLPAMVVSQSCPLLQLCHGLQMRPRHTSECSRVAWRRQQQFPHVLYIRS